MNNTKILSAAGLLIASGAQMLNHFFNLTDLSVGVLTGIGLGLILVGVYSNRPKPVPVKVKK